MSKKSLSAFTLIELLVVIAIIATIAAFAVPALTSALTRGQMTGTLNSARQLYLAGYQMALDGTTNSDATLSWPGDYTAGTMDSLQQYCTQLVQNDYLKSGDLPKLLSAPGAACTVTSDPNANPITVTLSGKSGLKVYKVHDSDSGNTIFVSTANYTYNTALTSTINPYGDKGFVVVHKAGDAVLLRKNNATESSTTYNNDPNKFQAAVGKLTGDADGTVSQGDANKFLTNPQ